jgi:hypothetical protein
MTAVIRAIHLVWKIVWLPAFAVFMLGLVAVTILTHGTKTGGIMAECIHRAIRFGKDLPDE